MRDVLRWAVRTPRVWAAFGAAAVATTLAAADERGGWSGFAAAWSSGLALLAVRVLYSADHPDRAERAAERERARQRARVAAILERHEARRAGTPRPSRARRRAERHQAEVDARLWRYERQRLARERARR